MIILIGKETVNEIQLYDIFEDSNNMYMLIKTSPSNDTVKLLCITDEGRWNKYDDLESAKKEIAQNVNSGRLKHYSQNRYHLELKES